MKSFSRRNFLSGIGGSILALPWMESLAAGPSQAVAQRLAFYYVPIGVVRRTFFPGEENGITPLFNRDNFTADETKTNLSKGEHPLELTATASAPGSAGRRPGTGARVEARARRRRRR